jgi:hypothetical protein
MIFPKNGAVVIVDDNIEEIEPLIYYFTNKGVPTFVSDGKQSSLPSTPLNGVRLLFLDMELISSNNPRDISTKLVTVIQRMIGMQNGPYILILWSTKNGQYEKDFRELLYKDSDTVLNPISIIAFKKEDIFEDQNDELFDIDDITSIITEKITDNKDIEVSIDHATIIKDYIKEELELVNKDDKKAIRSSAIDIISNEIESKLSKIDSMQIFFEWNNIVTDNDKNLVTDMLKLVDFNSEKWNDFIKDTLEEMASAEQGQSYKQGQKENIKSAFNILNELLLGNITSSLDKEQNCYSNEYKYNKSVMCTIDSLGEVAIAKNSISYKSITLKDKDYYSILINEDKKAALGNILKEPNKFTPSEVTTAKLFQFKEKLVVKKAKVNSKLFFTENINAIKPGAIISITNDVLKTEILLDLIDFNKALAYFELANEYDTKKRGLNEDLLLKLENEYKDKIICKIFKASNLLKLEMTPPCDYSQKNMISNRWLTGIEIPAKYKHVGILNVNNNYDNTGKYYSTKDYFNSDIFTLVFDKRRFHVSEIGNDDVGSVKMMMRDSVLNDIRDSVASHIGRKGILNL